MAVAVAVAAVALAVALNGRDERAAPPAKSALVFRVEPAGSAAAGDTARVLRERLTAAGVDRADVTVGRDGSTLTVTAPTAAREDVVALARRGRVAIYDWERSVLRADGRRAVAAPSSARSPDAYYAGAMTRRQAAVLAARPAGGRPVRDDRRDEWFVLAGTPALSDREIESAAAITTFGEQPPSVAIQFTARGETAFTALTPEIAHRGRERAADGLDERDAWQHLVIAIDEQIVAVPYINGRENPDGILAGTGTQIQGGLTRKTARQIAAIIDSGPLPAALSSATAAAPTTHRP